MREYKEIHRAKSGHTCKHVLRHTVSRFLFARIFRHADMFIREIRCSTFQFLLKWLHFGTRERVRVAKWSGEPALQPATGGFDSCHRPAMQPSPPPGASVAECLAVNGHDHEVSGQCVDVGHGNDPPRQKSE